ncbi:hypothetical protein Vadar_031571 [Vaccinium darrowii]|uniref:Uncharacterized protein n=1 Tax=Vaccinium darrowii TaxID=229202 RepID=A0ACB7XVJ6_9ERIC|nr:hypothetical protein Vadar_031571 [Vaccinium darrowii]
MPSGLPWVVKPLEGNTRAFGPSPSIGRKLNVKVWSNMDSHKPNENSRAVERYHEYMYSVPYSDHSCFAEIKEFVKIVQPTNLKGIVSSSSSYVDPLYYFGRLLGEKSRSQHLNRNFDREEGKELKLPIQNLLSEVMILLKQEGEEEEDQNLMMF